MTARSVQVSMDLELLRRIDSDPEVRRHGRSAFIRSAVELYLEAKRRRDLEASLEGAYLGEADTMLREIESLVDQQSWPAD
ncbi:MAG: ribbon-helix-helix protein, CopG family [Acidobacteriota bacterium]|nr:ribbon-helix-helix protein, CopG family [Acidobacteriota bacterium]